MNDILQEVHPGKILTEDFIKPMGLTNARLASSIDVPVRRISNIVNGRRPITNDIAIRLAVFFNIEVRFWLNLQLEYDLRLAEKELLPQIKSRIRPLSECTQTNIA